MKVWKDFAINSLQLTINASIWFAVNDLWKKVKSVLFTFRHFNNVVYQGDENS